MTTLARFVSAAVAALSLVLAGLVASPATARDDRGLDGPSTERTSVAARRDTWVNRLHPTANNERVDFPEAVIDKVWTKHKVNFTALVRVVQQARSPRMKTSSAGVDRGVYRYRIYEYVLKDGKLSKTGRWVVIQFVIEWGEGTKNRGDLVTAYPVSTESGKPPKNAQGKTYCPGWLASSLVMGPVNNDVLY